MRAYYCQHAPCRLIDHRYLHQQEPRPPLSLLCTSGSPAMIQMCSFPHQGGGPPYSSELRLISLTTSGTRSFAKMRLHADWCALGLPHGVLHVLPCIRGLLLGVFSLAMNFSLCLWLTRDLMSILPCRRSEVHRTHPLPSDTDRRGKRHRLHPSCSTRTVSHLRRRR